MLRLFRLSSTPTPQKPETRETAGQYYAALDAVCDSRVLSAMISERDEVSVPSLPLYHLPQLANSQYVVSAHVGVERLLCFCVVVVVILCRVLLVLKKACAQVAAGAVVDAAAADSPAAAVSRCCRNKRTSAIAPGLALPWNFRAAHGKTMSPVVRWACFKDISAIGFRNRQPGLSATFRKLWKENIRTLNRNRFDPV